MLQTFEEALREALRIQAEIGAPLADVEVTAPNAHTALCYLMFERQWHVIAFRAGPFDREQLEQAFIAACAYDSRGETLH